MHRTALALTGLAVVALGGTGIAVADAATPSTPAASPAASPAAAASGTTTAAKKHRVDLHADAVRRGKKGTFVTVGTQRGDVTAASPTSLTVRSADGFVRTYVLGPAAKVRLDKATAAGTDLKVGEKVGLTSVQTGTTWTLRHVNAHSG